MKSDHDHGGAAKARDRKDFLDDLLNCTKKQLAFFVEQSLFRLKFEPFGRSERVSIG
jgi:hypothetical protein